MKRYIAIVILMMAMAICIAVATSEKMLNEGAEETLSREDIEGGAMPCMLIEDRHDFTVRGVNLTDSVKNSDFIPETESESEQETSEEEPTDIPNRAEFSDVCEESAETTEEVESDLESMGEADESEVSEAVSEDGGDHGTDAEETAPVGNPVPLYSVNGSVLSEELSNYAYSVCQQFGMEWYFPTLLCQMYQESRFQQSAVSPSGDYGLMQLKGIYHDYFRQIAGIPWADLINDPFANIYCGVFLMQMYWNQCYDINTAISAYNTGSTASYNAAYVSQVRQWEATLNRIR